MTREQMLGDLKALLVSDLLAETPDWTSTRPLAWGVFDAISVNVLINFTSERFGIAVPQDEVTTENLKDLDAHVA